MKLLYCAVLHHPEDFERWLLPYLKKRCEVLLYDYRIHNTYLGDVNKTLVDLARTHEVTHVFIGKGEVIEAPTVQGLRDLGLPVACWTIDDHEHFDHYQKPYSTVFTPSPGLINRYHEHGFENVYELPFYVEPSLYRGPPNRDSSDLVRDSRVEDDSLRAEVSFLGTRYLGREPKITLLREHGVPVKLYGDQWTIQNEGRLAEYTDCLKLWRHSKINLNIHQPTMRDVDALNTKVYEIPAAGGFMLTDYIPELLRKFRADEVALYNLEEDGSILKAIQYWLADPSGREEVMMKAREHIFREHSAEKRADFILDNLK
jgi:spore maturation protein CgeB